MNLSSYNGGYKHKAFLVRFSWMLVSRIIFETSLPFPSFFKVLILNAFGAKASRNLVIRPRVKIKFPWKLYIGDFTWIGEGVWIDNLELVSIGSNCCISQGVYLLTGNHNYKADSFDLLIRSIKIEDQSWIGAKAIVCPGVTCKKGAVLSVGSIATRDLESNFIYQGNPALRKKHRYI